MTFSAHDVVTLFPVPLKRTMSTPSSAAEPTPKRARTEMMSFKDLNLEKLSLKDNGMNRAGNAKLVMPQYNEKKLQVNLTPHGFLTVAFGFDVTGKFEKPSFLVGGVATKSESLSLVVKLGDDESAFLKEVDNFFKTKFEEIDKKPVWNDLVKPTEKYGNNFKLKVVLGGENQTQIKIVGLDKKIQTGYGYDWLKQFLEDNKNFSRCQCKVNMNLSNLWVVSRKAGLTFTASHLVLVCREKHSVVEDDAFDDDELLAELGF